MNNFLAFCDHAFRAVLDLGVELKMIFLLPPQALQNLLLSPASSTTIFSLRNHYNHFICHKFLLFFHHCTSTQIISSWPDDQGSLGGKATQHICSTTHHTTALWQRIDFAQTTVKVSSAPLNKSQQLDSSFCLCNSWYPRIAVGVYWKLIPHLLNTCQLHNTLSQLAIGDF